ncbi:hypothetical protein [Pareuzebyella sediminis]|uniref:hypothetical protein n=1 Tax=Pareuzebyella sediminis TaxID=2607998 RepID=UPI0011EDB42D|nr:hypothetical protein [Pareuzebyella sediminis]
MNSIKKITAVIWFTCTALNLFGQSESIKFNEVHKLIETKNFFKAKEVYYAHKNLFPIEYQNFTEAILYNAFNQIDESKKKIADLRHHKMTIPDSLRLAIEKTQKDNAIKCYDYKEAKQNVEIMANATNVVSHDFKSGIVKVGGELSVATWSMLRSIFLKRPRVPM